MRLTFDRKIMKERVIIEPGEYHTTDCDRVIYTILGSCVSVCLKDEISGLAGMNHFMLPKPVHGDTVFASDEGRYGIQAMELLINEMVLRGADRKGLRAKVFGGGHVLDLGGRNGRIPDANAEFALLYLEAEGIPVLAKDLGGRHGRRVQFFTADARVHVQTLGRDSLKGLADKEQSYETRIRRHRPKDDFTLFDRRSP